MANYQTIVRLRPEVRDFIRNRHWVHRGDIVSYGPNFSCDSFSTDPVGFRHSVFKGKSFGVDDCTQEKRYGVVLGPSNVYGFGLAGNENTIPSLLAERFGMPFANLGLPEGNSRNLYCNLLAFIARAPNRPSVVLHLSGGDFSSFCRTSIADSVFGSPNVKQTAMAREERDPVPAEKQVPALLAYSSLWIRAIGDVCKTTSIPLVLGEDVTFFEKWEPNQLDIQCELGKPSGPVQKQQFESHREFVRKFYDRRQGVASKLDVPLIGPGFGNSIGFIDEYNYDKQGARDVTEYYARGIESVL